MVLIPCGVDHDHGCARVEDGEHAVLADLDDIRRGVIRERVGHVAEGVAAKLDRHGRVAVGRGDILGGEGLDGLVDGEARIKDAVVLAADLVVSALLVPNLHRCGPGVGVVNVFENILRIGDQRVVVVIDLDRRLDRFTGVVDFGHKVDAQRIHCLLLKLPVALYKAGIVALAPDGQLIGPGVGLLGDKHNIVLGLQNSLAERDGVDRRRLRRAVIDGVLNVNLCAGYALLVDHDKHAADGHGIGLIVFGRESPS